MSDRARTRKSSDGGLDRPLDRRSLLINSGLTAMAAVSASVAGASASFVERMLGERFVELGPERKAEILAALERELSERYGRDMTVDNTPAMEGVEFAYGLDIARCVGCRRCVYACVHENNQSRDPQIHWIRVLRMEKGRGIDLTESTAYYEPERVPEPEAFYLPVACQQCRNPACVKVCPVKATWQDPDGIVVIDYDWCIGCRCCMSACPYGARHFNWSEPEIPSEAINPGTHYFGNRPRPQGVVEKCTLCVHRTRQGRYPACVEICPVGARKFGNLLDEGSEMRYLLREKRVFVLKEELNTQPRFYYFYAT
jgi:molybdopterin-containing oxidoreductase family iron-sulfur binding subunit